MIYVGGLIILSGFVVEYFTEDLPMAICLVTLGTLLLVAP